MTYTIILSLAQRSTSNWLYKILINRLSNSFGISGLVLGWLTSYLSNRSQLVRVDQAQSNLTHCTSGVPQGSVLGPILFSIYTSPIAQIVQDNNILLQQYADDTLLYLGLSTSCLQTATSCLECCLSSLHAWFCYNGMSLNPMKSEATLLGSSRRLQSFPVIHDVSIASSVLPTTNKVTTLGVILDSKLTFDAHVSSVCRNAHFHLQALCHIRSSLTTDMATSIAVALIQSCLDYANSLLYRVSSLNLQYP